MPLIDLTGAGVAERCAPSSDQVTFAQSDEAAAPGLIVSIAAGEAGYPGLGIKPIGAVWDLSEFGHVEARITNTGDKSLTVILRVDNAGDWRKNPWNTESVGLKPGETRTAKVIFGYHYGMKPGYKLDPSRVVQVLFFTGKVKAPVSFRIESLTAAGATGEKPSVRPQDVRIKPVDGYVLGGSVKIDAAKQIEAKERAAAEVVTDGESQALRLTYPANKDRGLLFFRPPIGRWNFTQACEVRVKVKNLGATPITPGVQVTSDRYHGTETVFAEAELKPGASQELVVSFESSKPWRGPSAEVTKAHSRGEKGTGTTFSSDKADAVKLTARRDGEATMLVESIRAVATPVQTPEWLGKRPPVDGEWALTFNDEFDGKTINRERWNIYTENYWDKRSHFTKDNVVMGEGLVRLRMEKKTGHENDDPDRKQTGYAVGFLDTYGKWAQRYGYFEARMKLPTAPGLWPAFWMMPDRGPGLGPQWKRANTGDGGMEFDIMEHLTRWGPFRYNIAMHWDGYGKQHKSIGTGHAYVQSDPDGFITSGLLWTPGSAVYYCNGKVVARWDNSRISNAPSYPILYMVTGGWDNSPLDDALLPADFIIDYIRIWQRKDLASPVDGKIAPVDANQPLPPFPNAPPASGEIFTTAEKVAADSVVMEGAKVRVVEDKGAKVLQAEFPADEKYPAFAIPVAEGGWNLSAFRGAQVDVVNRGASVVKVALRVDNEGHWRKNPWNTESVTLKPGEAKTIQVTFGKSYGGNPGFALNPSRIVAFKVYADQPKQTATVLVRNLTAFGKP